MSLFIYLVLIIFTRRRRRGIQKWLSSVCPPVRKIVSTTSSTPSHPTFLKLDSFFFFFFFCSDMKLCMYILCNSLRSRTKIFYVKIFKISLSLNPLVNFNNIWYDDRYWSTILFGTIPTPGQDLQIKFTDLEILCLSLS